MRAAKFIGINHQGNDDLNLTTGLYETIGRGQASYAAGGLAPRPRCRNTRVCEGSGTEMPLLCPLPVQKYARFWALGGVYGALFSPAGREIAAVQKIADRG